MKLLHDASRSRRSLPIPPRREPFPSPAPAALRRLRSFGRAALAFACVALVVGSPARAGAANPSQASERSLEPTGRYLRDWLLCGPFPALDAHGTDIEAIRLPGMQTDFLHAEGGEAGARPVEGRTVEFPGGTRTWTRHRSGDDAINLDAAVSREDRVVAYAYREVVVSETRPCVLAIGSNDGIRAWFNGETVLDQPGPRGLVPDRNLVAIALRPGTNTLLLKIEERGQRWAFTCRLLPLGHDFVAERFRPFDVETREDGPAVLRTRQSPAATAALVKAARFDALEPSDPSRAAWSASWTGANETPIGVDARQFGTYHLRIRTTLADGKEQDWTVPFAAGRRVEHELFRDGKTDYAVFVGPAASESEVWAAEELRNALREVSGATPSLVRAEPGPETPVISIGWNDRTRRSLEPAAQAPKDDDESFVYRNHGRDILIWGGRARGTLYGVMSFLERELGVRYYTPTVTVAPKKSRHAFAGLRHSEKPGIRVRNDFYFEAFDPIWAARNRINGAMSRREQPGGLECYWSVHTFYPLMPPEEFFGPHPEYYSLLSGKRTADHAQLCLTHPDVLRIVTERIRARIRENPGYLIYDVSQNDWSNPCECRDCQAIVDREGSQSGPIIHFVNQVADNVRAEFPDKFIGTLAYSYTRKPPKTLRPRDNVVVRFCSIECCFAHDFSGCPKNASFVDDMNGWAAISPHIYIWDYVVNFSHYVLPFPNFRVLQSNIRFFRDHRAIGIMEQAAYQSRGGEFAELRAYVLAKLLWNPEADVPAIVDDFMYGYYGRAGQYVRAYFDKLHGRITPDTHVHLGLQPDDALFSDDFVREAQTLFDRAEAVADTDAIRRRVELARLPVLYLACKRNPRIAVRDGTYARFREIAERENVTHYAEAGAPHRNAFHAEMEAAGR
ncbi:MAG: DUF4838 domain-containing protein [Verrucomicrobiales bacterium]|nr:DUF4838 domain-containing protein [Verrucomicrobiales bacterium]